MISELPRLYVVPYTTLFRSYAVKYGQHLKGAIISSMVDDIDDYVKAVNRRRQEGVPQTEIDFMHECEDNNDYGNDRYQENVNILNINFVDRKQPSKLYHLKDIGGSAVYEAFQGDNEFVITGKLKDWHFRDQLKNIKVPTLLTFGENETMPIADRKRVV